MSTPIFRPVPRPQTPGKRQAARASRADASIRPADRRGRRLLARLVLTGALAAVVGCAARLDAPDRASLRVLGETVTVVAPEGLCIDPRSVDVGRAGGFAIVGDCAVVGCPGRWRTWNRS